MNKKYTMVLLALALTASAGAAERQVSKCLKVNAPRPAASRPATDYTGATADSIITYNGGAFVGELLTGGYPYLKTEFVRTDTTVVETNYDWDINQWVASDMVTHETQKNGAVITTDYYIDDQGEPFPYLRQYVDEADGWLLTDVWRYIDEKEDWVKISSYMHAEGEGVLNEQGEYYDPEGNKVGTVNSMVYYDERGEVSYQEYTYEDLVTPEYSYQRQLIGSYNEDGTIHTLEDEYSRFETEFLGGESQVVRRYDRGSADQPFLLSIKASLLNEDYLSLEYYTNGVLDDFYSESWIPANGSEGGILEKKFLDYDFETGEIIDGELTRTYYPDEDNEDLIDKVYEYGWSEELGEENPWAIELLTEYKYTEGYLCQLQQSGPWISGSQDLVLYGYDQYYYPENGLSIRKINGRELLKSRNLDLLGRRMNEMQSGLGIRNGKLTYSAE